MDLAVSEVDVDAEGAGDGAVGGSEFLRLLLVVRPAPSAFRFLGLGGATAASVEVIVVSLTVSFNIVSVYSTLYCFDSR